MTAPDIKKVSGYGKHHAIAGLELFNLSKTGQLNV